MGPTLGLSEMIVIKRKFLTGTVTVGVRAKVCRKKEKVKSEVGDNGIVRLIRTDM